MMVPYGTYPITMSKRRMAVFDCAVELNGIRLNKSSYQGPVMNNLILGVLLRLRRYPNALTGDLEAIVTQMHLQET